MEVNIDRLEAMLVQDWFREIEHGVSFCMAVEDEGGLLGEEGGPWGLGGEGEDWGGDELPGHLVKEARKEEVGFMSTRGSGR